MSPTTHALVRAARRRMRASRDPIHDQRHSDRVVRYAVILAKESGRSEEEIEALAIAAAWHDVARVITDRPSFLWMPAVDDLFSAFMLWRRLRRYHIHENAAALAVRITACKGLGTGAILTLLFFRKQKRVLVDILKDADNLDVLEIERMERTLRLTESSRLYRANYRVLCWWYNACKQLKMRTKAAKKYIVNLLARFIVWLKQPAILLWHAVHYGETWVIRHLKRLERLLQEVSASTAA